jgi:hypothetical protein
VTTRPVSAVEAATNLAPIVEAKKEP